MVKKKILILANTFYPILGGVETHLLDLIKELSKEKQLEVHLIASTYFGNKNNPYVNKYKNVKVNLLNICSRNPKGIISWLELHNHLFYFSYTIIPLFIYTFYYCLRNKQFDVIHANSHTTGVAAILISRIFSIRRKYISMHGIMFSRLKNFQRYNRYRNLIKRRLDKFDKIFCIGKRSYNEICKLLGKNDKLELFRYWVNDAYFYNKSKDRATRNLDSGRNIIFYAGRLVQTKGILLLLNVAKKLTRYDFVIAGDGDLKNLVEEESRKHSNIKYLGRLSSAQLPDYYRAAKISVLFTQTDGEGIPIALIESIACGIPVLATKRGGTGELLDLRVGLPVKNSQKDVKEKIKMILGNEKFYQEKREVCEVVARKYFSSQNAQIFIKNYLN